MVIHLIKQQILQNSFLHWVTPAGAPGPDSPWVSVLENEEAVACFPPALPRVWVHSRGHESVEGSVGAQNARTHQSSPPDFLAGTQRRKRWAAQGWGGRVSVQSRLRVRQRHGPREPFPEAEGPWTGLQSWEIKITTMTPSPPVLLLLHLTNTIFYIMVFSHLPRKQALKQPLFHRLRSQIWRGGGPPSQPSRPRGQDGELTSVA